MRRSAPGRGSNGGGGGSTNASPFIKPDRMRRNFLKARMGSSKSPLVKKDDPELAEERERRMLEQTGVEAAGVVKVKDEKDEEYNEFPLRAVTRDSMENMRTHLLKFQSKKKIVPTSDFHLPIRLHRKDTRNLQFQLTRAEIVQRQREIAEYKKAQQAGGVGTNSNKQSSSTTPATPLVGVTPTTPHVAGTPIPSTVPSNSVSSTPVASASATAAASATVNNNNNDAKLVTKLEEAGPAEDPTKVGLVKYDGKEEIEPVQEQNNADLLADVAPDGGGRAKRGNSRRKTRQIKVLDENAKKLRFEEFYPWVMEDYDGYNTWVGSYEAGNSDSYVLLSVEDDGSFTMIPADKVYKFTARNKYATLTIDEAEKRMDKKAGEVPRWLMKHLDDIGTTTTRYDRTKRRLKAVADQRRTIEGDSSSEHDDNSEVELDYDEEFADDEEAPIIDGNEQENKESEQRIKKEMLQANAMGLRDAERNATDDEEDVLFGEKKIDEEGERIKKALQKTELAALYSSDEGEINPYLSESDIENEKEESVKKEDSEEGSASKRGSPKKQQAQKAANVIRQPAIVVKSIKDCIIVFKADKKVLSNFAPGKWNPHITKRKRDETSIDSSDAANKKIKVEENGDTPLITEQDIIDAIGEGKVNVKEFGKAIRKKYPGSENKKRMFAIVKKLCKKVDNEHMELKK